MGNIRRYYVPNSIIFITQVVHRREPIFANPQYIQLLREILNNVKELHPFNMLGYVFQPEHFHIMIHPTGESNFSDIMHSLKPNFTKEYKKSIGVTGSMKLWQKGFWDHVIRDEFDLQRHLDYIHYNPVKHGYVAKPDEWSHSSYHHWTEKGIYPPKWGRSLPTSITNYDWQESEEDNEE